MQVCHWYADGALVCFSKYIYLLLVLPAVTSDLARTSLEEMYIIVPYLSRIAVMADVIQDKFVRLVDYLTSLAGGVVEVVPTSDVIKISCPQFNVGYSK